MRRVIVLLLTFMALIFTLGGVHGQIYTGCDHDEVLKSHPVFCNQFLQCSNGYLYEMKCDLDLVFNEKMQYCDWEHNLDTKCSVLDTTTSTTSTTTPEETTTTPEEETTTFEEERTTLEEETTTTPEETTTTPQEETTTFEEETTTFEEEITTQEEESCKYWYKYDLEWENYYFDSCTEATEEDFIENRCNRVRVENGILEPGERFKFEDYSDGNCFGFYQCIKFCKSVVHKCTFRCADCMENDQGVWKRGVFDNASPLNDTACFGSYNQPCFNNEDDEIRPAACSKKTFTWK